MDQKDIVWEDGNFKGYRKFLHKCKNLNTKVENHFENFNRLYLESVENIDDIPGEATIFMSPYEDLLPNAQHSEIF
jgi:hypothetical protein